MIKAIVTEVNSGYSVVGCGPVPYIMYETNVSVGDEIEIDPTNTYNHSKFQFVAKFVKKLEPSNVI